MVYHSKIHPVSDTKTLCGLPLLPLRTACVGPAAYTEASDVIDEALQLYRPNSLFGSFEVESSSDKLLIYLQLYINSCLRIVVEGGGNINEASKRLYDTAATDDFPLPGSQDWALAEVTTAPNTPTERDSLRAYLKQCRQELTLRMVRKCFDESGQLDKFWAAFARKKFLNKSLA
mmetsp:Transcript_10601/g.25119  ORF Transcript_10601/g.25119 Transcript_10601/m.25119 type:complete len:175 (-) Transcript_10601:694-1218(-)